MQEVLPWPIGQRHSQRSPSFSVLCHRGEQENLWANVELKPKRKISINSTQCVSLSSSFYLIISLTLFLLVHLFAAASLSLPPLVLAFSRSQRLYFSSLSVVARLMCEPRKTEMTCYNSISACDTVPFAQCCTTTIAVQIITIIMNSVSRRPAVQRCC